MPRYIDAEALDKRVYEEIPLKYFNGSLKTMSFVRELIEEAPTISPDEVRGVGEWLNDVGEFGFPEIPCSVCGYKSGHNGFKYCPNCGARMKGDTNGTTD